jgi:hypothetical protein
MSDPSKSHCKAEDTSQSCEYEQQGLRPRRNAISLPPNFTLRDYIYKLGGGDPSLAKGMEGLTLD